MNGLDKGEIRIFKLNSKLLEAIILSVVSVKDVYGYKITQDICEFVSFSESTLYPVLRRLKNNGFLESYNVESQGKIRCYYRITENGHNQLKLYRDEWADFKTRLDKVLVIPV